MYETNSEKILNYCENLSRIKLEQFDNYKIINPYKKNKDKIKLITTKFYNKYYNDKKKRRLILGSNPARRGTAVIGIPFEDAVHLQKETGIFIDDFYINNSSSNFLYDVITEYGGCDKFYNDFYMNFVFSLGISKINSDGKESNCNYYEIKDFEKILNQYNFFEKIIPLEHPRFIMQYNSANKDLYLKKYLNHLNNN